MPPAVIKQRPPGGMVPRPGTKDEVLTIEQLEQIELFAGLGAQPEFQAYPGAVVLRHYDPGEAIFRVGEQGWTAFYALTYDDLKSLRKGTLEEARARRRQLLSMGPALTSEERKQLEELRERIPRLEAEVSSVRRDEANPVARVVVGQHPQRGSWDWLRRLSSGATEEAEAAVQQSPLAEGELFGEMSCRYRTPRSATVVAGRDWYFLEMQRNILEAMLKNNRNTKFKERLDATYRERVLDLLIGRMPFFRNLPRRGLERLRDRVELLDLAQGDLVCDENDRSDAMYLIRSGFVQVFKGGTCLLAVQDILDWPGLCTALRQASQEEKGARRKVWDLLPEQPVRARLADPADPLSADDQQQLVFGLNDLLKSPDLCKQAEFKDVLVAAGLADAAKKLPRSMARWEQHRQVCEFNRRLLQAIFPGMIPPPPPADAHIWILSYPSAGQLIGEMGVLIGAPRSATCVCYGHPDNKFARVELVRIAKTDFDRLMAGSLDLGDVIRELERYAEQRQRETELMMGRAAWDVASPSASARRFQELGLIQGQKLMLIDLDRCTRCDECVRACVATHTREGAPRPRSRLFLDGPVFRAYADGQAKNYLVPMTCRQCRDPVCLIGCPVCAIHKGDNGQIVIEDWCIGCSVCANQCPYGSIQMHAIGLLPRGSDRWRFRAVSEPPAREQWWLPGYRAGSWSEGRAPFRHDWRTRERLGRVAEVHFRHSFEVTAESPEGEDAFQLRLLSLSPAVTVWVNGQQVIHNEGPPPKVTRDKGEEYNLEVKLGLGSEAKPSNGVFRVLRRGRNVVAVRAKPPAGSGEALLEMGVYRLSALVFPAEEEVEYQQDVVMNRAVVCDLCSEQFGQKPACVTACPHEAALRVDACEMFPELTGKRN